MERYVVETSRGAECGRGRVDVGALYKHGPGSFYVRIVEELGTDECSTAWEEKPNEAARIERAQEGTED